jgi:hypothetical protein
MLSRLFMQLRPVHLARTQEEREALYRFRYRVYVEELRREIGGVDHERRIVHDAEDDRPYTHHLYAGSLRDIEGVVRLRVWDPGQMPAEMAAKLAMHRFGAAQARLRTSEIGRFMIDPRRRGAWVLPSMARKSYEFLVGDCQADVSFCYCRPGLVDYYRRLGARPYGAELVDEPEGMEVPLVSVLSDHDYYRRVNSPMAHWVKKHFGPGRRAPVDARDFGHLFDDGEKTLVSDSRAVWAELSDVLDSTQDISGTFLDGLPRDVLHLLVAKGFAMDVPAGQLITREGHVERELYIVLSGAVEVLQDGRAIRRLGPGEVFGEIAFFRQEGKRSASVRALQTSRIVTLRRRWLDDLGRSKPAAAQAILLNLARTLAERAARPH